MTLDIFLSHSSHDADAARDLRGLLEAAGYSCWMAPDDVTGSQPWAEQILSAIDTCQLMIVLLSVDANQSPHVSREVSLAVGRGHPVLPIRLAEMAPTASLEYLLSLTQRLDAFPPPVAQHADRIVRRVAALATPSVPASEPPAQRVEGADQAVRAEALAPSGLGPGSTIDDYTIESVLGEGGMATVYRATQAVPRRTVALKVIRADLAVDPAYRDRFLAESETLAGLEHPNIVPV